MQLFPQAGLGIVVVGLVVFLNRQTTAGVRDLAAVAGEAAREAVKEELAPLRAELAEIREEVAELNGGARRATRPTPRDPFRRPTASDPERRRG